MSRTAEISEVAHAVAETPGKRGRKATPPDPAEGPVADFAHELWKLKRRAGDPSFATMCTRLGAAASKSSLAAATRGSALPSWETTWEFVRVLAVESLGADRDETRREWLARWRAAAAGPAERRDTPADTPAADTPHADTPPLVAAVRRGPRSRRTRNQTVAACAFVVLVVAGLGSTAAAVPSATGGGDATTGADDASFEGDVTFPDGSVVAPGATFTKVWQLRNTGTVRWEGRYLSRVNTTACQAPEMVPIPATDPGRSVRIAVPVTASSSPAHCKIDWKMTDAAQRLLLPAKNPVFLDVVVRGQG